MLDVFALFALVATIPQTPGQERPRLRTSAVAAAPEGDLPPYAGTWSDGFPPWLTLGFEGRARFEDRSGRLRGETDLTHARFGVTRARLLVGVQPKASPLGVLFEVEDSRQIASDLPATSLTVNEADLLQLRATIDLQSLVHLPADVQIGRMSFDAIDRRLIARNRFRNTVNAFEGLRLRFGAPSSRVGAQLFALWPTERRTDRLDELDRRRKLLGAIGRLTYSSSSSPFVVEPYYLFYEVNSVESFELHTTGAHLFGALGEHWDHDAHVAIQLGTAGARSHRAFAARGELGRRFNTSWQPRVAGWLNYASGDADLDDDRSGRFNPLFGASHAMYGFTDLFSWQNIINPAASLSVRPHRSLSLSVMHRLYWLASESDAFVRAGLLDPTGNSGRYIGQELDLELTWSVLDFLSMNAQFGELFAGGFVEATGGGTGARVFYLTATLTTP